MRRYLFYIFLCCFVSIGFSQNTSAIDFVIKNLGINVDGHFNSFSVTTKFDDVNSDLERISGTILVSSIKTGIDSRDEHLLGEDYFNAEKHKEITLKSKAVIKVSDTQYKVKADLKIKGITKEISIIVDVLKQNGSYKMSSSFQIDRKNFKVGGSSFVLSKTVKINVIHYQKL
jgi:polyisoprenoid-binding protein YceI